MPSFTSCPRNRMPASFTHLISVTNFTTSLVIRHWSFEVERVLKDHLLQFFLSTEKDERVNDLPRSYSFLTCLSSGSRGRELKQGTARDITENPSKTKRWGSVPSDKLSEEGKALVVSFIPCSLPSPHTPSQPQHHAVEWPTTASPIASSPRHGEMERWEGAQGLGCRQRLPRT